MHIGKKDKPYTHKLDKSMIPTCNIMGVNIAAVNMYWVMNYIKNNIELLSGDYMCVSNVHTTVTAFENNDYMFIQNNAIMSIPDGGPLSSIGRRRGFKEMRRVTGPSFMDEVFKVSVERGYKHYFYGSTKETLEKLRCKLERKYPGINIVGMHSPPFRPCTVQEDEAITKEINKVSPDFVWVGLGAPKQEEWMSAHFEKIKGFMVGVGAGFDYFAGNIKRAPKWMQYMNMEWLYRLLQDPKRLFKRYFITNSKFVYYIILKGK